MNICKYIIQYGMSGTPVKRKTRNSSKTAKRPNPTLESIEMVEETLAGMNMYPTKNRLWRNLPRQIQYQTFRVILDYLEKSNKILYDDDGTIVWIFSDATEHESLQNPLPQ